MALPQILEELLALEGPAFVRNAYREILGRGPDPEGEAYYMKRLISGISKMRILTQLRLSAESKAYRPDMPELDPHIRRYRRSQWPLVGRIFGLREGDSPIEQKLRAIENQIEYQPSFSVNPDGVYNIGDFLSLYDRNFVHYAYLSILRREPDSGGLQYYLERVRSGISRVTMLGQMMKSSESKKYNTKIAGLNTALFIEWFFNVPILGSFCLAIDFLINIKNHLQDLRALENYVVRVSEDAKAYNKQTGVSR